jgi:hypothetical protein
VSKIEGKEDQKCDTESPEMEIVVCWNKEWNGDRVENIIVGWS